MQCNHAFIVIWAPCYMCVVPCACTTHCCTGLEPLNKWKKEHEVCEGKGLIKAADGCRVLSAQCTCSYAHDDSSCSYIIDLTQLMMMILLKSLPRPIVTHLTHSVFGNCHLYLLFHALSASTPLPDKARKLKSQRKITLTWKRSACSLPPKTSRGLS